MTTVTLATLVLELKAKLEVRDAVILQLIATVLGQRSAEDVRDLIAERDAFIESISESL